jgi:hypothetical protein
MNSVKTIPNENESVDISDLFKPLSINQLEHCLQGMKNRSLLKDKEMNLQLFNDVNEMVNDKKILVYAKDIRKLTPEFKTMIVGVIERLMKYEIDMQ